MEGKLTLKGHLSEALILEIRAYFMKRRHVHCNKMTTFAFAWIFQCNLWHTLYLRLLTVPRIQHTNRTHTIYTSIVLDYDVDSKHAKFFGKYRTVTDDWARPVQRKNSKSEKIYQNIFCRRWFDWLTVISTNIFQTYIIGKRKSRSLKRYNFLEIGVTITGKSLIVQHNTIL